MTYEIKLENNKYNIYYSGGPFDGLKEFHSLDGVSGTIREGYKNANSPNWNGLTQSLWGSSLMGYAATYANPNGFSLLLKVLTDGEINSAAQQSFLTALSFCGLSLSVNQKAELNAMLTANNFTIQV